MRSKKNTISKSRRRYKRKKVKYTKKRKFRKSRNKKKGGLTGVELALGGTALGVAAFTYGRNRYLASRKNKALRDLREKLNQEQETVDETTSRRLRGNYLELVDTVMSNKTIRTEDITGITMVKKQSITDDDLKNKDTSLELNSSINNILKIMISILGENEESVGEIMWSDKRIFSGSRGDIAAVIVGDKFILFKALGLRASSAIDEIYGTIKGSELGISSKIFQILIMRNNNNVGNDLYAFAFQRLRDGGDFYGPYKNPENKEAYENACKNLSDRSEKYGFHRDASCTHGARLMYDFQNIMIDDSGNTPIAYYCDMGSFNWKD